MYSFITLSNFDTYLNEYTLIELFLYLLRENCLNMINNTLKLT